MKIIKTSQKKPSYSCVLLDGESKNNLLSHLRDIDVPDVVQDALEGNSGWEIIAHHMTIKMGGLPESIAYLQGEAVTLTADKIAFDDKVVAVQVSGSLNEEGFLTNNAIPHITVAVNRANGGKPFLSNKLTSWQAISSVALQGTITEIF